MQFTVRLPRWLATTFAIVVASVAVAALLPAVAASDGADHQGLHRSDDERPDRQPDLHRQHDQLEPAGRRRPGGRDRSPTGAAGAAGAAGAPGPAFHLAKAKPTLEAKIEASLAVQSATLTDINHDLRDSLAITQKLAPSTDPTLAAVQTGLNVQGAEIARLVNVLRGADQGAGPDAAGNPVAAVAGTP